MINSDPVTEPLATTHGIGGATHPDGSFLHHVARGTRWHRSILSREDVVAGDGGVRRRDVLKGLGVTGAVAGIVATPATSTTQAEAQPAAQLHAHALARDGQSAETFR